MNLRNSKGTLYVVKDSRMGIHSFWQRFMCMLILERNQYCSIKYTYAKVICLIQCFNKKYSTNDLKSVGNNKSTTDKYKDG